MVLNLHLTGRMQRVVLNGQSWTSRVIISGVSILGPLLFSIFMNGIFRVPLTPSTKLVLYADDIVLYKPLTAPDSLNHLQQDILSVSNWIHQNNLVINLKKTNAMIISRSRNPPQPTFYIGTHMIDLVSPFKYLGVTIHSDLSWSDHIDLTSTKAKKKLGFIYRSFNQPPLEVINNLYKSLVLPYLDYCSLVWDPSSKKHITSLEKVQKFAYKIMTKEWSSSTSTNMSWQALSTRRNYQKLTVSFKIIKNLSIQDLSESSFTHSHHLPLFHLSVNTSAYKNSFFY